MSAAVAPLVAAAFAGSPSPDTDQVEQSVQGLETSELLTAGIILAAGIVIAIAGKMVVRRIVATHNEIIARLTGRLLAGLIVVVALIYSLSQLGIRVGLLLGALGVGGFALAFALQDILSNLIAGVILQIRQPFTYQDYVSIEEYEGTVTDINLRAVEMKLFSGEAVIIPSSTVLQNPIENWTRLDKRRIEIDVGVAYDADMDHAVETILGAVSEVDGVLPDPAPVVTFDGFGDSSINFTVFVWFTSTGDYFGTRLRAATAVKRALDGAGIDIPFPMRTVTGELSMTGFAPGDRSSGPDDEHDRDGADSGSRSPSPVGNVSARARQGETRNDDGGDEARRDDGEGEA